MPRLRIFRSLLLAVLCLLAGAVFAGEPRVLVVNGVSGTIAGDFIGALKQSLGGTVSVEVVPIESRHDRYPGANVVLTLGATAAEAVLADAPPARIVASLLPRGAYDRLSRGTGVRSTALFLGQPYERQLAVLSKALPDARRVGVLVGPNSEQAIPLLEKAAREAGLSLLVERSDGGRLHGALRSIIASAQVLLVLPDPQVFNASSIQGILLETYRARIPLIGISPAYTRAGAVMSLAASTVQLGSETARLVREVLAGDLPAPRYSQVAEVHVNRQVVRSLGLDLPTDESLLSAARSVP